MIVLPFRRIRLLLPMLYILLLTLPLTSPTFALSPMAQDDERYLAAAVEATDWITSFQVAPLNSTWGIPYLNPAAWGLDPFYYSNGTITGGTSDIVAGQKQQRAFLIGGHDAGEGASAALDAYLFTGEARYLKTYKIYLSYFENAQIPNPDVVTPTETATSIGGRNVTIFNGGFWADQAEVVAGASGGYGRGDDRFQLSAVFPAAEHGDPIAASLIAYYRLTGDDAALRLLNRYGNWLVRTQIKSGEFAGAFPVTQYYLALGWKPRMFETTESAWILSELFVVTRNQTYLNAAVSAGNYMLSTQFVNANDTHIRGALPYVWNETHYSNTVLTNHAGYALLAWTQLFRLTNDDRFLDAAERYADWLMSFQVTPNGTGWGDHAYSNDSMTVGGFYYGYNTEKRELRTALSLWSAAYSIPGLLHLAQLTNNVTYRNSAVMAADWLTRMRYDEVTLIPLQALMIIKYVASSWWGLYPQFYQPDMREVEKAGIPAFVAKGEQNPSAIADLKPTWFELTFSVDFNLIDYHMASRGAKFMKMIWSQWPDVGFEPRYGGDIAIGEFAMTGYLDFLEIDNSTRSLLNQISTVAAGLTLPLNVTASFSRGELLLNESEHQFHDGWYPIAAAEAHNASAYANAAWNELTEYIPLSDVIRLNSVETLLLLGAVILLVVSNLYWYRRVKRTQRRSSGRTSDVG